MVRKIFPVSDIRLRKMSKSVQKVDKKLLRLISDLEDTLKAQKDPEGMGLAAPQIGEFVRVFLIKYRGKLVIFVNPEVVEKSEETNDPPSPASGGLRRAKPSKSNDYIMEGCLSLPYYYGPVQRAAWIKVKYQTLQVKQSLPLRGESCKPQAIKRRFTGFVAQIIQHEIDHLDGKVFVDRLLEQNRQLFKDEGKEFVEVEL